MRVQILARREKKMKKIVIAALALGLVGSAAFAQTNSVLSRNAVGYVKVDAVRSNLTFIAHNFIDINGGPVTVTNLLGTQVPVGTTVTIWDPAVQQYRSESRNVVGWNPGTNRLNAGRGFWLRIPNGAASNSYAIYLMGEVPDKTTLPTSTVSIVSGLNMTGYPFPVATHWTNTTLAKSAPVGATVVFWNPVSQAYNSAARNVVGWNPSTNRVFPGQGFWFRTTIATNWTEVKPYTWP